MKPIFRLNPFKILVLSLGGIFCFIQKGSLSMVDISVTDWVGYLASAIVFVSFLFVEIKKIRIINMIGAVVFVVYGLMLESAYPIVVFNSGIILLHLYHLITKKSN